MRQELQQHLSVLLRSGLISLWSDRVIMAGGDVDLEISANLESADIILALLSSSYLASHFCSEIEAKRAMELHEQDKAHVIPIILRDCDWKNTPFGKLLALPTDGRPVKSWPDRDRAYKIVADKIRAVAININGTSGASKGTDADRIAVKSPPSVLEPDAYESTLSTILSKWSAVPQNGNIGAERFLPQLADLIETGDDLQLRHQDSKDAGNGRTINYIFDENVFELFLRPSVNAGLVALFHKNDWKSGAKANEHWRAINAQSAVLTGEYLFSGSLPGQSEDKIYLTSWHRKELLHRVAHIGWGAGKANTDSGMVRDFLFRMASFRAAVISGAMSEGARPRSDGFDEVLRDTANLKDAGVPEGTINAYVWTRIALHTIAEDDNLGPLLQIKRLFSREYFTCIRSTDELARRSIDQIEFTREAAFWQRLFEDEYARRSTQKDRMRSSEALYNDARSLALLHQINRGQGHEETTLFVTGDSIVFSAYRRWHSETCPEKPFLLRRVAQYAPAFALGGLDDRPLELIGHLLDFALSPFNLTHWNKRQPGLISAARRSFAQQIRDDAPDKTDPRGREFEHFFSGMRSDGYRTIKLKIQKLGTYWRDIETLVLGLNPDLLGYRVRAAIPDAFLLHPDLTTISDEEIGSWISSILATLLRESLDLWLPLAEEMIATARISGSRKGRGLEKQIGGQLFCFAGAIEGRIVQSTFWIPSLLASTDAHKEEALYPPVVSSEEPEALRHSVMVFAVAAGASARRLMWSEAFHFSQLCIEAAKVGDDVTAEQNLKEAERLFEFIKKERAVGSGA